MLRFTTFNIFTIRRISKIHIYIFNDIYIYQLNAIIRFAYFYVFSPQSPLGSSQTSMVMIREPMAPEGLWLVAWLVVDGFVVLCLCGLCPDGRHRTCPADRALAAWPAHG